MGNQKANILVIDDEESMLLTYKNFLKNDYNPVLCKGGKEGLEKIKEQEFAAVILDLIMPEMDGMEVLSKIKKIDSSIDVLIATAINDTKHAVRAMQKGAFDYITKPFELAELAALLHKISERKTLIKENLYLRASLEEQLSYSELIGNTPIMQNIFMIIENISPTNSTVLITGESGTGKELVAQAIHKNSLRKNKPLVIVNCAAIPENLLESELFGHERGAFTGAVERKLGKFELADQGTIFLDEIGSMPKNMQAKLLRVLQDSKIDRVGGKKPILIDVRIIAATNTNLEEAIKNGIFRDDLYYRLNVIPIKVPSLKERKTDIPSLVKHFIKKFNKELNKNIKEMTSSVLEILMDYDWPGNVRELQNVIERAVALNKDQDIIKSIFIHGDELASPSLQKLRDASQKFERNHIKNVLEKAAGNQSEAARILGIHRTTLISKLEHLGLK
ncbi:MAG: sigma-54-dependent Fis family transcriptional regulator [Candidatus Saganbacteria bacterium]|nr:sigma-54-dependent Fis family transcriptional regulator [Candidatus Saganbacteria bacterium]